MIRFGQESAEDKEDHSRYFKQKGICQGSYKIIGRAEEEARDCAFENDSQNNTLNTGQSRHLLPLQQSECWEIRKSPLQLVAPKILS